MSDAPDLAAALGRIEGHVWRTPSLNVPALDEAAGRELWLKCEALQRTGSFKLRGATNAIASLAPEVRGVVAASSGNHAQAVARAARGAGLTAVVVMNANANPAKRAATIAYGAEVISDGIDALNREAAVRRVAEERGLHLVHPFDDWDVISGAATASLELFEDAPPLDTLVAPIGGGGLLSGAALAAAERSPTTAVWGAEPATADDASRSLREGRRVSLDHVSQTIADGARPPMIGERPCSVLREHCAGIALVSDDELRAALALVWSRTKVMIEPTAALPIAAILSGQIPGRRIGVILSGGNVDGAALANSVR